MSVCVTSFQLNDKDMGMLEERIKRAGKVRPPSSSGGGGVDAGGGGGPSITSARGATPDDKAPRVARVAPNQTRARKVRREFQLELDDGADDDESHSAAVPQLVTHDDLDELLNSDVVLPETRSVMCGIESRVMQLSNSIF